MGKGTETGTCLTEGRAGSKKKSPVVVWGCSLVGRALVRHVADAGSIPKCGKGFFSQSTKFQCRLCYVVSTPLCAIACMYICVHTKDPIVHVRVWWIMETLKHPAYTIGWVVQLSQWLSLVKATRISHGRNSIGTKSKSKETGTGTRLTEGRAGSSARLSDYLD